MKTRMTKEMALAVPAVLLLAVACGTPEDDLENGELDQVQAELSRYHGFAKLPPQPVYSLKTTDVQVSGHVPANKTSFPIGTTLNIYVAADYQNVGGAHAQSVQFYAPGGSFYQKFDKSICIGTCTTGVKGETIGSVTQYWETLPVAGSYITQYALSGTWRADLYVDGVKKTSATFTIQ